MAEKSWKAPGNGSARAAGNGMRRIVVSFDDETFDQVRQRAAKSGVSFGSAVRELVEFGLIDAEEEEAA